MLRPAVAEREVMRWILLAAVLTGCSMSAEQKLFFDAKRHGEVCFTVYEPVIGGRYCLRYIGEKK